MTVYLSSQWLYDHVWTSQDGTAASDFGVAYVVAHEMGHAVQHDLGITEPDGAATVAPTELQADCLAGVWSNAKYYQNTLEAGDIDEAVNAGIVRRRLRLRPAGPPRDAGGAHVGLRDRLQQRAGQHLHPGAPRLHVTHPPVQPPRRSRTLVSGASRASRSRMGQGEFSSEALGLLQDAAECRDARSPHSQTVRASPDW